MKKVLLVILIILFSCATPKKCCGQDNIKDIFKFSTFYAAVNGGTSISDVETYSVTDGLQTQTIETPYDYSVILGVRKISRMGYEPKEAFKTGKENSFSDAATVGKVSGFEYLFELSGGPTQEVTFDILDNCTNESFTFSVEITLEDQTDILMDPLSYEACYGDVINVNPQINGGLYFYFFQLKKYFLW